MKILILGGCGFIGTNIAIEAIKRGHSVVAFDNLSRREVENNLLRMEKYYPKELYQFVWGDVRKKDDFEKLPIVDAIINMAANPSVLKSIKYPTYDFETNALGVSNSLELAKQYNIPYIYASTNKTFTDITNEIPMTEEEKRLTWKITEDFFDKNRDMWSLLINGLELDNNIIKGITDKFTIDGYGKYGHSPYGVSKLSGELLVQEYGIQHKIPTVIFKMSCIYGLFQKGVEEQAWIDWFLRQLLFADGTINIFGTGKQVRDILDGRDTARAYLDALENIDRVKGEIFTLGGGPENTYSLLETIKVLEKVTGKKANLHFYDKRPSDQDIYISSIKKIEEKLGWKPEIKLETALHDMMDQYGESNINSIS